MRYSQHLFLALFLLALYGGLWGQAESPQHRSIAVPDSTVERPQDRGIRAHTNHLIRDQGKPNRGLASPGGESPASIRSVYDLPSTGGSGIIAIVDAFDYPTAEHDLEIYSTQFGLPACTTANGCFKKVFASGSQPQANCGWGQEAALDIEWAHAMAPNARIVLVEAASNSFTDLFTAVDVATAQVTTGGGKGEVSMSWSGGEFSTESSFDGHFQNNNVVYFASSGDTGGINGYPSVSPYVVSAGGTTIHRNGSGQFTGETGWSGSGGGPSKYENKLSYQNNVTGTSATKRSAPDFSFDADPNSGVSVYDSTRCQSRSGWLVFGGTSVSSSSLAGVVNLAGHFATSTVSELTTIYANRTNASDFRDIVSGSAGSFSAAAGYDFVTGVGSSQGTSGK
jgi:subtilase family serine protease